MNENERIEAENMLINLLTKQPNLIKEVYPSKGGGEEVADFCAGFIRRYSEHLEAMKNGQSRQ